MAKRNYIPITADVPGVSEGQQAFIRKVIRTALTAEGVDSQLGSRPRRRTAWPTRPPGWCLWEICASPWSG